MTFEGWRTGARNSFRAGRQAGRVRGSVGPEYDDEDEVLLATLPATWTGPFGLDLPGTAAAFKVDTQTEEGNEKGSNAVTVERPA